MDDYTTSAILSSKIVTETFSTSFSSASELFSTSIRSDIYNIYALVRVADEIVDTYQGIHAKELLDALETEVYQAIERKFSANIIVHAFMLTATKFDIHKDIIKPFFASMRTDLTAKTFNQNAYQTYIYGSAEVVGLMCLKVFCEGNKKLYTKLEPGARALGSAFQKVNFLRDIKDDYVTRGRYYFPIGNYETFGESEKKQIITDIDHDFEKALIYLKQLPSNSAKASRAAFAYYQALLKKLKSVSAEEIKDHRISVSKPQKLLLLVGVRLGLV